MLLHQAPSDRRTLPELRLPRDVLGPLPGTVRQRSPGPGRSAPDGPEPIPLSIHGTSAHTARDFRPGEKVFHAGTVWEVLRTGWPKVCCLLPTGEMRWIHPRTLHKIIVETAQ